MIQPWHFWPSMGTTLRLNIILRVESDDESEDSEADEFDMEVWDDDGGPLVDDNGHTLVPMDDNVEYDESTAQKLMTFAVTYRQVRGALQGQRRGRDQKLYQKSLQKGNNNNKPKRFPPKPFQKNKPPPRRSLE